MTRDPFPDRAPLDYIEADPGLEDIPDRAARPTYLSDIDRVGWFLIILLAAAAACGVWIWWP